ncbi:MAG: sigma 54-interacting transcriptional regulator [Thermoanaerobacteraceae bacterium]|uniref:sigma 54-interacting transcriptional regulator n=1 Tax=Thermanaeromonas sp. C210 TaxID=2731925 RepID=UPI00155BF82B|nr:sigma 54-interacting transcriptional regulator [Thermanaeromonas sp. C210]MBE3580848.1 sigma 54-interacting transcriptional regulator [Thermoanaerobacteraceae bacterium]GFN21700.1 sigma-54-dependent Fis family transcriptional regulator [Thermanaeromonas sp. C210]
MSARLGLVAPYGGLAELAHEVCRELGLQATVAVGDLAEGVRVARDLVARGIEVIVSRGGTATAIGRELDVPVVEIAVSAFDLVRALGAARTYGSRIGVVGFRNVIYGCKSLEEILGVRIQEIEIKTEEEAPAAISAAREAGIQVIVGDAVSVRLSKELGLHAILVTSGKEAIGLALREAEELAEVRRKERARAEQFKVILDFTYEGIIATDPEGRISLVNPAAEKILGVAEGHLVGRPAGEVLPGLALQQVQSTGKPRLGELHRAGSSLVVQNVVPVIADGEIVGAVATFQDASHLQAVEAKVRQELYLKGHVAQFTFADMVTGSPAMQRVIAQAREFAAVEGTILITGETGTGKEMLAQSIHNASRRRNGPFVAVNCAAVPESLLESELFGYEEGAFTGARKGGKKGYFELAHRGTLFLDEIGELPLNLQARLLRVLQQRAVMRVGGDRVIPVDVRIIAATHRDLEKAVREGSFRQDLYYRLNVLRLSLPPLRQRGEDIPHLVGRLVDKICRRTGRLPPRMGPEILRVFQHYPWPGNVRELENVLERLVVLRSGLEVTPEDLEDLLDARGVVEQVDTEGLKLEVRGTLNDMEKAIICAVLEETGYNRQATCRRLGISPATLWRRMKAWGIAK